MSETRGTEPEFEPENPTTELPRGEHPTMPLERDRPEQPAQASGPAAGAATMPAGAPGASAVPPRPTQPPVYATRQEPEQQGEPQGGHTPFYGSYGRPDDSAPAYFGMSPGLETSKTRREPRRFGAGTLVGGMVLAALIGGGSALGANFLMNDGGAVVTSGASNESVVINNPENVTAVSAAAAKATPSVVTIEAVSQQGSGSGSGIILDKEGHILTNTHVVTLGGATSDPKLTVQTSDGRVHSATVVGLDPLSDLAVIKVEADNLTPAELGSSGELNVGDTAVAIGAPLGLSGTVTDGIVSKLDRTITVQSSAVPETTGEGDEEQARPEDQFQFPGQDQSSGAGSIYINVIQTDAAINHGNSGGALVDVNGRIIGVNVAIASAGSGSASTEEGGSIGVGFAIPIDYAKRIAGDLIKNGEATHGLLGVSVQPQPASEDGSSSFSTGAIVREVVPDSPAEKAGLKEGDIITGVGDRRVDDSLSLTAVVREYAAGDTATVTYLRNGREEEAEVTVGASEG